MDIGSAIDEVKDVIGIISYGLYDAGEHTVKDILYLFFLSSVSVVALYLRDYDALLFVK